MHRPTKLLGLLGLAGCIAVGAFALGAKYGAVDAPLSQLQMPSTLSDARPADENRQLAALVREDPKPDTCARCIAAANARNIVEAQRNFTTCNDASLKSECRSRVKTVAPSLVRAAALNGDCTRAKIIARAANAMGAGSRTISSALKQGDC